MQMAFKASRPEQVTSGVSTDRTAKTWRRRKQQSSEVGGKPVECFVLEAGEGEYIMEEGVTDHYICWLVE